MPPASQPSSGKDAPRVAIVGGGPAGLMAAEVLSQGGASVDLFDAMPSVGRKFLLAGRGGLNLTHSEPTDKLIARFGAASGALREAILAFDGPAVREWAAGLGVETFVGSSGRVFPTDMKAAPLLRAWLHRLRDHGVRFHARHRWVGWDPQGALRFTTPGGEVLHTADATVLALGGASWSRLGSDGAWVPWLAERGVDIAPLRPANCGFDVAGWSEHLKQKFAGQPLKTVAAAVAPPAAMGGANAGDPAVPVVYEKGEFVVTETGVEGSLVYALSAGLRETIDASGEATLLVDLLPQHSPDKVLAEVRHPRGPRSLSTHLKSRLGLQGLKMALLHELLTPQQLADPAQLARAIKSLPIRLVRPRPIDEAISTAGGIRLAALDGQAMLRALPGTFCAGEMLDWEAPTGGYLLTACMATGRAAAQGALRWLAARRPPREG